MKWEKIFASHTHTHTHYSAMRKKEILPFATMKMDHESIMLRKITQTET